MGKWIELKPDRAGSIAAWRADPDSRPRAGMVVVQEIFGVNSHIRAMADRFASVGYLAIAPAVFDRIEKGFDVGYDPDSRARGMAIVGKRSTSSRRCATSPPPSRSPAKPSRSGSSAIASADRSFGRPPRGFRA